MKLIHFLIIVLNLSQSISPNKYKKKNKRVIYYLLISYVILVILLLNVLIIINLELKTY